MKEDVLISKKQLLEELRGARYDIDGHRVKRTFEDAVDIVLKCKEADPKWISLKDEKPHHSGDYLCIVKFYVRGEYGFPMECGIREVVPCTYTEGTFKGRPDIWTFYGTTNRALVTHWMPFPEAPRPNFEPARILNKSEFEELLEVCDAPPKTKEEMMAILGKTKGEI